MILPLIFALQMAFKRWFRKNKEEEKSINFNNQRKIIIQNSRQSRRFFVFNFDKEIYVNYGKATLNQEI